MLERLSQKGLRTVQVAARQGAGSRVGQRDFRGFVEGVLDRCDEIGLGFLLAAGAAQERAQIVVDVTVFGGVLDPAKLKFPYSNPGIKAMGMSDLRDWEAIEGWADSLPEKLNLKSR